MLTSDSREPSSRSITGFSGVGTLDPAALRWKSVERRVEQLEVLLERVIAHRRGARR